MNITAVNYEAFAEVLEENGFIESVFSLKKMFNSGAKLLNIWNPITDYNLGLRETIPTKNDVLKSIDEAVKSLDGRNSIKEISFNNSKVSEIDGNLND